MSYASTESLDFRSRISAWIEQDGEVLVLIRYSRAAGSRDYELFALPDALLSRLDGLPAETCVTVFRHRQLPLRGRVDNAFVAAALDLIPDGEEYLIAGFELESFGRYSWFPHWTGVTHEELVVDLNANTAKLIAMGIHPPWLSDNEEVQSAVVPHSDGRTITGIY